MEAFMNVLLPRPAVINDCLDYACVFPSLTIGLQKNSKRRLPSSRTYAITRHGKKFRGRSITLLLQQVLHMWPEDNRADH